MVGDSTKTGNSLWLYNQTVCDERSKLSVTPRPTLSSVRSADWSLHEGDVPCRTQRISFICLYTVVVAINCKYDRVFARDDSETVSGE